MVKLEQPWAAFGRQEAFTAIAGRLWRFVESQEQVATSSLVGSLAEQILLEEMLEVSKPPRPAATDHLDYLLATPFRYPPLPWGSRFGREWEPGIFYGACSLHTAQAEAAYYRLKFWQGMRVLPPSGVFTTQHHSFSADYACEPGARLQDLPWARLRESLTQRTDYSTTQALGTWLRQSGLQGFEFESVRCPQKGINVALLTPEGLAGGKPEDMLHWLCQTKADGVVFSSYSGAKAVLTKFTIEDIPL